MSLFLAVSLFYGVSSVPLPGLVATDLRCEYQSQPLSVDERIPRLSWVDNSRSRGWKQTAYEVIVSSSESLSDKDKGDLWDSGKVSSDQSTQIAYRGKPLGSRQICRWKVRVWDNAGHATAWSRPQWWQMGLLGSADWKGAQWIGQPGLAKANPAPFLRKTFSVSGPVRRAEIYVCGLGYADVHLNGDLVSTAERDPAYTNFDKRVLYVAYDVTGQIKQGKNALGAVLGTGWYDVHDLATWRFDRAPWRGRPRLKLLLAIDYADGRHLEVPSDSTWNLSTGPILWDGIYTGEMYDARREMPGWDRPTFDDHKWIAATVMPAPKGVLAARVCPPISTGEVIRPKAVSEPVPGIYVVDFGQNFSGHVRLHVKSRPGQQITMRYSERLDSQGMIQRSEIDTFMTKKTPPQPFQTDIYVCKGAGLETWEQRFSYSGFRYVEFRGVPHAPDADMVEGVFAHTDLSRAGEFACSSDLLNKIQRATLYSYQSNAQSILTDCPQREKNGWTGDAQLACEAGLMNFRSPTLYSKWLDDLSDDQDRNGLVSDIVPSDGWGHGAFNPAWDSAYPIVVDDLYNYCGDSRVIAKHYDNLKRYVDALYRTTRNGVVPFDSLGDWEPWSTQTPSQVSSTAFLYLDARIIAKDAALLGKTDESRTYAAIAETVKKGFNAEYLNAERNGYSNNSQTANAMAIYFDLVPPDLKSAVLHSLVADIEKQGHIDSGILGGKFILRALSEHGRTDLAYKLVSRTEQPGWGWWIKQGATTLWEDWKGESSLNHIMFGDVSNWFYQWIAGIGLDPASPGFEHIRIQPQVVGDLRWASASYDSPHGLISSAWRKDASGFHLDITVPANTSASVSVPSVGSVSEGGKPLSSVPGVSHVRVEGAQTAFEVGSGSYSFTAKK